MPNDGGPHGPNEKVYIHEFIDIIGQNRAKYMHHMTANWCPIAREERNQLCFGVWGTVGSTGRWPETVNIWELDGWDGLAKNFAHELGHSSLQDPSLEQWWATASTLRRGGVDRIVVPEPWSPTITQLTDAGVRGALYAHELVTLPVGRARDFLDALRDIGRGAYAEHGLESIAAFKVAMKSDHEAIAVWAIPDWAAWAAFEQAWDGDPALRAWRASLTGMQAVVDRILLVDAPLSPLRIGRQPEVADRLPLDQV
jgi:hypothetical protein